MNNKTLRAGSLLQNGKYRIIEILGQGGFGITYLAEQTGLGRRVAVKEFFMKDLCNRDDATSEVSVPSTGSRELVEKFRHKFLREARMIAALDNPHIVRIYDVFEENGTAYYVMEHLDGGSLTDEVRQSGPLPEARALDYIRQVADALAYLHGQNILHFDVKPSNILVGKSGQAVLIDFGISKHYDEAGSQTSSTPVGISKGYAPMEQYQQGEISTFTPATDIYSLGATLYFLLTGQTPPSASEVNEDGLPPLPSGIDAPIREAIVKAMAPRRKDRPQTVKEFLALLEAPVPDEGESEETEPIPPVGAAASGRKGSGNTSRTGGTSSRTGGSSSRTGGTASGNPGQSPASSDKKKGWLWGVLSAVVVAAAVFGIGSLLKHGENATPAPTDSLALVDSLPAPAPAPAAPSSAELEYGTLKVESTPAGAAIWLDGKNTKKTTPEILEEIAAGSHRVVLKLDGYQDITKNVTVKKDERTTCTLTLKEVAQPTSTPAQTPAPAQTTTPTPAPAPSNVTSLGNGWSKTKNGYKTTYTNGEVSFTMVAVAGGTFTMGSSASDSEAYDDEKPAHSVTVSGFSIGETEVTQALWQAVMGSNPSYFKGEQRPVERVSYNDCKTFISRLNSLTGENFRLPTEAEWEFAARGGNRSQGYKYSGSNSVGSVAWYDGNSGNTTHSVKTKSPNELGLYDMTGNVWEWCYDWKGNYSSNSQTNPRGPQSGSYRVYRGGSWDNSAGYCRVAFRYFNTPGFWNSNLGLRLAQ